jgi:small subunit ribosomal protein S21
MINAPREPRFQSWGALPRSGQKMASLVKPARIALARLRELRLRLRQSSDFLRLGLTTQDTPLQVLVRDNNVDQALKALKKKMQREGIFREMKLRGHYEKPSEKRAREKAEAVRRARKLARKKLQREGLLPMKPKPVVGAPRSAG